jgi:hypothetical protein
MSAQLYTQEQLDVELLKQRNEEFSKSLNRIESNQKWMLSLMGSGFIGPLGLMAHGFNWII